MLSIPQRPKTVHAHPKKNPPAYTLHKAIRNRKAEPTKKNLCIHNASNHKKSKNKTIGAQSAPYIQLIVTKPKALRIVRTGSIGV